MLLKFVIKNLLLVAVIAFAINMLINANLHLFARSVTPHASQLEELTQEELFQEREMLN